MPKGERIRLIHYLDSNRIQDEYYTPAIKLGDVTEVFVLLLARVQRPSPASALTGLCESTHCAPPPLHPLFGTQSGNHEAPLPLRDPYEQKKKMERHKGNQQIPFALALRNIIGPNHHLFSLVKSPTAGLDKREWKICRVQDAAKTLTDLSPPLKPDVDSTGQF